MLRRYSGTAQRNSASRSGGECGWYDNPGWAAHARAGNKPHSLMGPPGLCQCPIVTTGAARQTSPTSNFSAADLPLARLQEQQTAIQLIPARRLPSDPGVPGLARENDSADRGKAGGCLGQLTSASHSATRRAGHHRRAAYPVPSNAPPA